MDAVMGESDVPEQQSSFGIKKIVDCKIGYGGRQMYKVKWEATWEPAETLVSCQHLIDEFWSFVNIAKTHEEVTQEHRKIMMLKQGTNISEINFDRISDDNKAEVQRLIARANATSVGGQVLRSPSNMLMTSLQHNQQNNLIATTRIPPHSNKQNFPNYPQIPQNMTSGAFGNKGNAPASPAKVKSDDSEKQLDAKHNLSPGKSTGAASLKYIEGFSNPYVKIIVACKICNKEQSLKFTSDWRKHFLTHSDVKPHQCPHCSKSFLRADRMRNHVQSKHGVVDSAGIQQDMSPVTPKQEHMMA